jgi:hypothetical protein
MHVNTFVSKGIVLVNTNKYKIFLYLKIYNDLLYIKLFDVIISFLFIPGYVIVFHSRVKGSIPRKVCKDKGLIISKHVF